MKSRIHGLAYIDESNPKKSIAVPKNLSTIKVETTKPNIDFDKDDMFTINNANGANGKS